MKLSTKTVASLLVTTAVAAAVPGIGRVTRPGKNYESQFDKILQKHDRKGHIRAEVLGISVNEFKEKSKKMTQEQVVTSCGFTSKRSFRLALLGRLRNELRTRGWTSHQIDSYIASRAMRMVASPA